MVYILCHCWVIIYSLSKIYIVYNIQLNSSSGVAGYVNIKKVYIRRRNTTGDREKLYIMLKGAINQEKMTILNV